MPALRFRYSTVEIGNIDVHLRTLKNTQQFHDPEQLAENLGISSAQWPLFGVLWPSSQVLANFMLNFDIKNKRILEVGCGIGLTSLLLNKRKANITATDYHPEVEGFLEKNARLNDGKIINYERLDWKNDNSDLGLFDLIIGSDLLYEDQHIEQLSAFINKHTKPCCEVFLIDPDRGRKNKFTTKMSTYGYNNNHKRPDATDYLDKPYKGHILGFNRAN